MYCYHCMSKNRDGAKVCVHCGKEMKADVFPHHLKPGTVLDKKYLVGNSIGEGGFGITYVGLDLTLDMKIAIKEFFPTGFANRNNTVSNKVILNYQNGGEYFKTGKEHFLSEAKNIAKFHSEKSIVDVRAYFEENETAYIIMEYLDGDNLSDELKVNGTYEPEALFRLFIPVMQTLKKMHREHIIHRDISPENVRMVSDGTLKLMDFGSARYYAGMEKRTMSVQYKPGFSPFEQYNEDGNQGPWTDVYGLCATIYKCITGKTPVDSVARSQTDTLKKPSEWGANISKPLEAVLMYGLAVYPENRCKDMDELMRLTERELRNQKKEIGAAGSATSYKTKEADEPYKTMFADENHGGSINNQNNNSGDNSGNDSGKKFIITIVSIVATLIVAGGVTGFLVFNSVYKNDNKNTSTDTTIASETDDTSMTDISQEKIRMTDFSGKKLTDAETELDNLGLKIETQYEESEEVAAGYVIRQSIQSERWVNKGDTVMIYVSSGKHKDDVSQTQILIDVETEVAEIRTEYYKTQENPGTTNIDGDVTFYKRNESITKIVCPNGLFDWNYSREYYFKNNQLYFAFIYDVTIEHRLYFADDILIRYIDDNENTYNYGNISCQFESRAKTEAYSLLNDYE